MTPCNRQAGKKQVKRGDQGPAFSYLIQSKYQRRSKQNTRLRHTEKGPASGHKMQEGKFLPDLRENKPKPLAQQHLSTWRNSRERFLKDLAVEGPEQLKESLPSLEQEMVTEPSETLPSSAFLRRGRCQCKSTGTSCYLLPVGLISMSSYSIGAVLQHHMG